MYPLDSQTQSLLSRERVERLRQAKTQPSRRVGLRRAALDDDQAARPLLARAFRAARV